MAKVRAKKKAPKKAKTKAVKKSPKKAAKAAKPRKKRANSSGPAVRIRMFRQGLGDCFFVTFNVGGDERHMLIDGGTLGKKATDVKFVDIAEHLDEVLGDGKLDIVVATHEHQDHLSGFNTALKGLEGRVEHVWLAWTENPADKDAKAFAKHKNDLGMALGAVAQAMSGTAIGQQVYDLLGFAGDMTLGAAKFAETVDEAMEFVRTGLGAKTEYYEPGDLIQKSWLPGFRIYVLGPPRDESAIGDLGEHGSSELYGISMGLRNAAMLHAAKNKDAASSSNSDKDDEQCGERPFDRRYIQRDDAQKQTLYPTYLQDDWRKIEGDWLNVASDLALQLDNMTNNSSLVLAIERVADGRVLLFPADAQQGNWLSWHAPEIKWSVKDGSGTKRTVTAADLLARTVFYKVGHHASHNATARGKGLELMEREDELVAFIPVDRAIALTRNPKDSWQMPARPLYRRLLERCQGRVVRSDLGWAAKATGTLAKTVEKEFKELATDAEWIRWQTAQSAATHVSVNDLYVEYLLE